jgi:hypothetical protein
LADDRIEYSGIGAVLRELEQYDEIHAVSGRKDG